MDTELLKTFLEVKNTRHFGKAAENLFLTQAAVSARVKQLEDNLGVKLFIRSRNNIQLTIEGERLVPYAETMLLAWSRARQDVALKLEQKHQLNMGTTAGLWRYVLQDKLPVLHKELPDLSLRAEAYAANELLQLVMDRVLDLALSFEPANVPELTATTVGKLKLVLATTIDDVSPKTALSGNYVYVDWGTAFGVFHAKRFTDAPPAILHTNMASIAETFILDKPGSAYLPEVTVNQSQGRIRPVEGAPAFSRDLYVLYRSNSDRIELVNEVMKHLHLK